MRLSKKSILGTFFSFQVFREAATIFHLGKSLEGGRPGFTLYFHSLLCDPGHAVRMPSKHTT